MNKKYTLLTSALVLTVLLTGCTAEQNVAPAESASTSQSFIAAPVTGEKTLTEGLELEGNQAHQKLLEVLSYSQTVAKNEGYVEKNDSKGQESIFIYSPAESQTFIYDVTGDHKLILEDNSILSVFGIQGFLEYYKNQMQVTLKDNIFEATVAGAGQTAKITVKDGLIIKTEQVEAGETLSTSDISYVLTDMEKAIITEALSQPEHEHDENGNDIN